jgi:chemotaxis protein MotA
MLFAVGCVIVGVSVVGGFLGAGGHIHVLWQPFEFLIIFGSALGAFIIANPPAVLFGTLKSFKHLIAGSSHNQASYLELLSALYAILKLAKTKGDLALEAHIDRPAESSLFQAFPRFARNATAMEFLCDYLRLLTLGTTKPHEMEAVMDAEIEAHRGEHEGVCHALQVCADGLPALGIVAAVLGVIHTMGSITEPPEILGQLIGGALVGTFTGVLASYGLVAPIAKAIEGKFSAETDYLECIKASLIAHTQGYSPQVSVEFARKIIRSKIRPSFNELDEALQTVPAEAAA